VLARLARAQHQPEHERDPPADKGEPRRERGPTVAEAVVEVARPEALEDDPRNERNRQHGDATRDEREGACESERRRRTARCAPRLRDRHRVGDVDEEPRHLHQDEHEQRPAEREGGPPAPQREPGERQQQKGGDGDDAAAAEHLGGQAVVAVVRHDEARPVVGDRTRPLAGPRIVRQRLVDDRFQPEEREHRSARPRQPGRAPRHATRPPRIAA